MATSTESSLASAIERPRDPLVARVPIFYGWVMLPIAMIAQVVTSPGQTFAIAVFNQSFTDALQLSERQLTGAFGLGTLSASLALPFFGALMDRWGIRRAMTLVVFFLGVACLVASQARGLFSLFLAFLLLRAFGQGALSLFATNTLAMWFRQRLGTATGVMSVGCVLIMGQIPRLIRLLLDEFGWRGAYAILGIGVWCIMLPLLFVLFRNRPEDIGQRLDGELSDDGPESRVSAPAATSFDLAGAMRTRAYWIVFCVQAVWALVVTALVFNVQKIFLEAGHEIVVAERTLVWFFCTIAVTQLVGGVLADRVPLNALITISVGGMIASVLILLIAAPAWTTRGYLAMGFSQGLLGAVVNTIWARFYGRAHVGKIRGSVATAMVAGSALGPFLMGYSRDVLGSYSPSLWLFLGVLAVLALCAPWATRPQHALAAERISTSQAA